MNRLAAALFSLVLATLPCVSMADTTTFNFTGDCLDCSNPQGQLIVNDYTYGTALYPAELVGFTYTSSLADVSVTQSNLESMWGYLGSTPGSYPFTLVFAENDQVYVFATNTAGDWCYGPEGTCENLSGGAIGIDHGVDGVFSPAAPASTPEPSSLLMLGTGAIGGLGVFRRKFIQRYKTCFLSVGLLFAVFTGPSVAHAQCTNMTSWVRGSVKVGSDGWVIGHFTNNSSQTLYVMYAFKKNGVPSNSMADQGAGTVKPGQTVGGELQGLYSTSADKNPAEIYWYAVLQSDIDAGKRCEHHW